MEWSRRKGGKGGQRPLGADVNILPPFATPCPLLLGTVTTWAEATADRMFWPDIFNLEAAQGYFFNFHGRNIYHRGLYLSKAVVGQRFVERGGGGAVSVVDV